MNISFYLVLVGLALLIGGVACKKVDSDNATQLFIVSVNMIVVVTFSEFCATIDSTSCAIDNKQFSNVTCVVKPNEKPVRVVFYQKCFFKKTAMKTETVMPGQVKIFTHAIVIDKNEINMPF